MNITIAYRTESLKIFFMEDSDNSPLELNHSKEGDV